MKVYVIVPVYNAEKYLKKCLNSLISQTFRDIEIICVNDGSKDSSLGILEGYKKNHSNIVIIDKQNGGLSSARNAGLNSIKNFNDSFILFVDSDDYLSPDYVEHLLDLQKTSDADIVCSSYYIDCENVVRKTLNKVPDSVFSSYEAIKILFEGNLQSHAQCKLYKGFIWENQRFDENICFMEDQALTFKLFLNAKAIQITDWAGYYFTISKNSLCRSKMSNKKILSALRSYKIACDFDYTQFSENEKKTITEKTNELFAGIFLMMFPRFDYKGASDEEKRKWDEFLNFVKTSKVIKSYHPKGNKEKIKRFVFLYLKPFYKLFYLIFIK